MATVATSLCLCLPQFYIMFGINSQQYLRAENYYLEYYELWKMLVFAAIYHRLDRALQALL